MRTRSYEQLERSYNRFDERNGNGPQSLYDRVLDSWWGSSSPQSTIRSYYRELNRAGRRKLLGQFAETLSSDVFQTILQHLDIID
jgi:hypothetical protein